jgi:peptidoglycan hydrolase-like protein with peptidoglycan-binding domain
MLTFPHLPQHPRTLTAIAVLAFTLTGCGSDTTASSSDTRLPPVVAGQMATTAAPTTTTTEPVPTTTAASTTTTSVSSSEPPPITDTEASAVELAAGDTVALQTRLLELGYWHWGVDGIYGVTTTDAVVAYQKLNDLPANGDATNATRDSLAQAQTLLIRLANNPTTLQLEINLRDTVAYIRDTDRNITSILNIDVGTDVPNNTGVQQVTSSDARARVTILGDIQLIGDNTRTEPPAANTVRISRFAYDHLVELGVLPNDTTTSTVDNPAIVAP